MNNCCDNTFIDPTIIGGTMTGTIIGRDCAGEPLKAGSAIATCKDLAASAVPMATDTVAGKVELAVGNNYPQHNNDTDATTPAYVKAAMDAAVSTAVTASTVPKAADTVAGKVELAVVGNFPQHFNDVDATTPAYVKAAIDSARATGEETKVQGGTNVTVVGAGTSSSPYIVNADLEVHLDAGSNVTVIGSGIKTSPFVVAVADATDTVKGVASLAIAASYPSNSDTEAATPAYVGRAIGSAFTDCNGGSIGAGSTLATCANLAAEAAARQAADAAEAAARQAGDAAEAAARQAGDAALQAALAGKQDRLPAGADGQLWTAQPDGSGAWETAAGGGGGGAFLVSDAGTFYGAPNTTYEIINYPMFTTNAGGTGFVNNNISSAQPVHSGGALVGWTIRVDTSGGGAGA